MAGKYDWAALGFNLAAAIDALTDNTAVQNAFRWHVGPVPADYTDQAIDFWDEFYKGSASEAQTKQAQVLLKDMIHECIRQREARG